MDGEVNANEWLRDTLLDDNTSPTHRLNNLFVLFYIHQATTPPKSINKKKPKEKNIYMNKKEYAARISNSISESLLKRCTNNKNRNMKIKAHEALRIRCAVNNNAY